MGEEEVIRKGRGMGRRGARTVAAHIGRLATPWRLATALTLLFFSLTLVVYHFTSLGPSIFNHPVRLADAFLHARLDVANAKDLPWLDWAIYDGKYYPLEPPMTAVVVLPGVALYGLALNQTLVSVVVGALNVSVVYRLMRGLSEKASLQVGLTLLFAFGTVYWWNAVNGGVWYFAHTLAVLFLFLAVYATLIDKRPFLAGLFLGAAYLTRLPTILALPFFIVMFSDQWLPESGEKSLIRRIDLRPLLRLAAGVGVFVLLGSVYNYVRFDTPLHASYYYWHALEPNSGPGGLFERGLFDITYIPRHIPIIFEKLPYIQSAAPYVVPSWSGMAFWATTPAFLYALFAGVENRYVKAGGALAIVITLTVFTLLPAIGAGPSSQPALGWAQFSVPYHLNLLPFFFLIAYGLFVGIRNKLVLACWLAIIPIALTHFTVGVTGWPQFGYRYVLDYAPFLFLLTWLGIGDKLRWHHMVLIAASIVVNLAGVLWINKFDPNGVGGVRWVDW